MCGIFGYVGTKDTAASMTLEGLKLLEYRGYDSWGIAVKHEKKLRVDKHTGKIGDAKVNLPSSNIGIGHTRWATHGGVTVANAHPHLDCTEQIAVLHNGIVENFAEIKDSLIKKGHTFISETDTEVISHLIEEHMKTKGFSTSVREAFNALKGMNAIVVMNAVSTEIVAAKNGSPLVVGVGEDGYYVASDASGIVKHTKKVIFLEDNYMIILGKQLKLIQLPQGKEVKPHFAKLDWEFEDTQKGNYKHFLMKEIAEQPQVLKNIALNYSEPTKKLAKLISTAYGTFMLGCGTASYAALSGVYLFSKIAKKHINYSIGSEFSYLEDYLTPKSLIIPISQSGETIDVVGPVEKAKQKKVTVAAIVNVMGSTLYRQADYQVMLGAGQEKAVIGTKSFIAMFAVLLLTAYTLAKKQKEGEKLLLASVKDVKKILDKKIPMIKELAKKLKNKKDMYVLGRGLSYAAALEGTLKLKETSYTHAEGFAGGELKHGVIALIEKGTPCFVIAPNDETYDEIISNAQEVKARGGYIIGVGSENNSVYDFFLETADIKEASLIPHVVMFQLLAYHLALEKGIQDPDKPRNLAKSVTVK